MEGITMTSATAETSATADTFVPMLKEMKPSAFPRTPLNLWSCALGFPFFSTKARCARWRHDAAMSLLKAKETYPSYVDGVQTRDLEYTARDGHKNECRLFSPECARNGAGDESKKLPIIVFFHGGGWVFFSGKMAGPLGDYDGFSRHLCKKLNAFVVNVDYRMAPEHPFPHAPNDCYDALKCLGSLVQGGDGSKIILAGDSAGGNLTAVVSLMSRDLPVPNVRVIHQLLIYPCMYNRCTVSRTDKYMYNAPLLPEWCMRSFEDMYTPEGMTGDDMFKEPYVNPESAPSLQALPAATGILAGKDILRDEGASYFKALERNGNPIKWKQWDDEAHGFVMANWKKHPDMVDFVMSRLDEAIRLATE